MFIYQPIEVLIYVLYLCNTLITTNNSWWWESHMMNQSSSQTAFPEAVELNTNIVAQCNSQKY